MDDMRASDADREAAVERLRAALNEGRLNLHEYDDRLARSYQAVTYRDLDALFVDLPPTTLGTVANRPTPPAPARPPRPVPAPPAESPAGLFAGLPRTLKVLWTLWLTAVSINLVVWFLVSASNGSPEYFWPMWVAGPWGAGLFGLSAGATMIRRSREASRRQNELG